jgi:ATP-dependent DNA helicase RecQ
MSAYFPVNPQEFLLISGVGQHKLETYGKPFLQAIGQYVEEHPEEYAERLTLPTQDERDEQQQREYAAKPLNTERETLILLCKGKSVDEICTIRSLKRSTVLTHLDTLVNAGIKIPFEPDISPERLEQIADWFRQAKSWNLTPAVELSTGQLDYEEARLARIVLRQRQKAEKPEP